MSVDWNTEPMRIFRAYARHDFDVLSAGAAAGGIELTHYIDQSTAFLREKLLEAGIDLRNETALYYFVLGSHLQWSHQLGHVLATCGSPDTCGHAAVVHSANASVGWRIGLRAFVNSVTGVPAEPDPKPAPEYGLVDEDGE